jgi:hypothetical protein
MMPRAIALALCACAVPTDSPQFQGVAEMVPDPIVEQAVAEVEGCLGYSCDLTGWGVFYAAAESPIDMRFVCSEITECGPRPDGCSCDAMCPCRCRGLFLPSTMQIVIASTMDALKHELVHLCAGVVVHSAPEFRCQ